MKKNIANDAIELTYRECIATDVEWVSIFMVVNPKQCEDFKHLIGHYVSLNGMLMYCLDVEVKAHNKGFYAKGETIGVKAQPLIAREFNMLSEVQHADDHLSASDKRIKHLLANTASPQSHSVIQAMRSLEAQIRHEYDPDTWGGNFNPFEIFPIKLPKLSKEEIMVKLRARLNPNYMPSSTLPKGSVNSKPQYLDEFSFGNFRDYSDPKFPSFPLVRHIDQYGTVSLRKVKEENLFAYYGTPTMEFLTNLETEQTLVRTLQGNDRAWYDWDSEPFKDQKVAVNPYVLDECIDVYL